jgi:amino acid transporter
MKFNKNLAVYAAALVLALPFVASAAIVTNPAAGQLSDTFLGDTGAGGISGIITTIITIALTLAGLIAILFLIIGGFRYVTAGGNEEQAEAAKKTILNAIIGIIVIILAFVILAVIENAITTGT